ncbi:MAG: mechanosensitive ion channel [Flavobacteriia bacterium]|nr:mechanosensitive ion channel [Flavobacteriia bacterium]
MLSTTLFSLGPYKVCLLNIFFISLIVILSIGLRRIIHRLLKRYLTQANIRMEGQRTTWLRLLSQSVYILAIYISVWSFNFNNEDVTFIDLLNFKLVNTKKFQFSFYHFIIIFAIFFGARMLLNVVKLYINRKFKEKEGFDQGTEYVYMQLAKYVVYLIAGILSLQALDVKIESLLLGSAGILVGLGLGLQDVFKDMFSGIILLFEGNIRVGDVIEIGSKNGVSEPIVAKILKINVRTTQIQTRDGNVLIMPNVKLTQEFVENWTHGSELTRFIIPVTVAYGSDAELASRLLRQAAMSHPKVKKTQPVEVRLAKFGENGMELELVFWADQSWDINFYKSDIRFEIDRLFREYKVIIPFHQTDVRIFDQRSKF